MPYELLNGKLVWVEPSDQVSQTMRRQVFNPTTPEGRFQIARNSLQPKPKTTSTNEMDNIRKRKVTRKVATLDKNNEPEMKEATYVVQGPSGAVPTTFLSGAFDATGKVLGHDELPKEGDALLNLAIASFPIGEAVASGMKYLPTQFNAAMPSFVKNWSLNTNLLGSPYLKISDNTSNDIMLLFLNDRLINELPNVSRSKISLALLDRGRPFIPYLDRSQQYLYTTDARITQKGISPKLLNPDEIDDFAPFTDNWLEGRPFLHWRPGGDPNNQALYDAKNIVVGNINRVTKDGVDAIEDGVIRDYYNTQKPIDFSGITSIIKPDKEFGTFGRVQYYHPNNRFEFDNGALVGNFSYSFYDPTKRLGKINVGGKTARFDTAEVLAKVKKDYLDYINSSQWERNFYEALEQGLFKGRSLEDVRKEMIRLADIADRSPNIIDLDRRTLALSRVNMFDDNKRTIDINSDFWQNANKDDLWAILMHEFAHNATANVSSGSSNPILEDLMSYNAKTAGINPKVHMMQLLSKTPLMAEGIPPIPPSLLLRWAYLSDPLEMRSRAIVTTIWNRLRGGGNSLGLNLNTFGPHWVPKNLFTELKEVVNNPKFPGRVMSTGLLLKGLSNNAENTK